MRSIACAAVFFSFALLAGAQTPPDKPAAKREPPPGTLRSLAVKGNKLYSAEDIAKASGLKQGQKVSPAIVEQARLKLLRTELFSNVTHVRMHSQRTQIGYREAGITARIDAFERPEIHGDIQGEAMIAAATANA